MFLCITLKQYSDSTDPLRSPHATSQAPFSPNSNQYSDFFHYRIALPDLFFFSFSYIKSPNMYFFVCLSFNMEFIYALANSSGVFTIIAI